MSEQILFCMNLLLTLIETITLFLFGRCFFTPKYQGKRLFVSTLLLYAVTVITLIAGQGVYLIKTPLLILFHTIWLKLTHKASIPKSIIVAVFFQSYATLVDNLFIMGFAAVMHQNTQTFLSTPQSYYLFCYSAKCVELLGIVLLRLVIRQAFNAQAATWQDWSRTVMFPLASMLITLLLLHVYAMEPDSATQILLCSVVLLVTDILAIFLLNYLEQQQVAVRDNIILKHSIKLEQENISAWMHAYTSQRKQTHDFQNQLTVIKGLAEKEAPEGELLSYVNSLLSSNLSSSMFVNTGRSVVDVIINQKYAFSQTLGIDFQIRLDNLAQFALPDDALVVVLSNLIDNAIEACEKIKPPEQRIIVLKMQVTSDSSILYIENTTADAVRVVDNHIVPERNAPPEHGYGLKNVASVLDSHGAVYALDYRPSTKRFCFSAQFFPD